MPPASETTSGLLATAKSARISDAVIPAVRAANRSVAGSGPGTMCCDTCSPLSFG